MEGIQQEEKQQGLMTSGPIAKQIFYFAMPLLLGNLFQQLYNAVDSAIVGNFAGKEALAAVGSSASMINLIVSLFMGIAIGGSVTVSQYYGAGDHKRLHHAMHSILAFSVLASIVMSVAGVVFSRQLLIWMGTPEDVIGLSTSYFQIFFGGSLAMVFYNMGSGLLRAVGDSKRPLIFLIISSIVNIVLDLLFVAVFNWGVAGAAAATVAAQGVSAVLVMYVLMHTTEAYQVHLKDIRFYSVELKKVIKIGLPSGVQNAVVSFSNVFVQSSINLFGSTAMAGCGAYMKIDGFAILPAMSFSMALTTFVGQNMGAGNKERVKAGVKAGTIMATAFSLIITIVLQFIAEPLLTLFTDDAAVIAQGLLMMHVVSLGYVVLTFSHAIAGTLRGVGLTKVPMVVMIFCWCVVRMIWIAQVGRRFMDLQLVLAGYPVSWLLSTIIMFVYITKVDWINYYEKKVK